MTTSFIQYLSELNTSSDVDFFNDIIKIFDSHSSNSNDNNTGNNNSKTIYPYIITHDIVNKYILVPKKMTIKKFISFTKVQEHTDYMLDNDEISLTFSAFYTSAVTTKLLIVNDISRLIEHIIRYNIKSITLQNNTIVNESDSEDDRVLYDKLKDNLQEPNDEPEEHPNDEPEVKLDDGTDEEPITELNTLVPIKDNDNEINIIDKELHSISNEIALLKNEIIVPEYSNSNIDKKITDISDNITFIVKQIENLCSNTDNIKNNTNILVTDLNKIVTTMTRVGQTYKI